MTGNKKEPATVGQMISTYGELEALDPHTLLLDAANDFDQARNGDDVYLPAVVIATGRTMRHANALLEDE